jgi:prolyl-tRNA synthetase
MRTRLFLRTAEFLWQEGHTAHETAEEALEETDKMINIYADFAEQYMAVPVIKGRKTENERFAGAIDTYCIEGLMQDGKALQMGTSHFLGQNFAKAFDVKFLSKENKQEYVWATSWGVSTRLIGALIMAHSDNKGLVLPPKIAPIQVVIIPIYKDMETLANITSIAQTLKLDLESKQITVKYDDRDNQRSGWKFNEYELKGIPVRITIGPKDMENNQVEIFRRDTLEKQLITLDNVTTYIEKLLQEIQQHLFDKAYTFRENNIHKADTWDEFVHILENKGGFVSAHWDGTTATEELIKEKTKASIRCIPFDNPQEEGRCIVTGNPSKERVLFAKAY